MADYRRMEWQYRVNRIAGWIGMVCVFSLAPEVIVAMRYHFPWYDDLAITATIVLLPIAYLLRKYTNIYRAVD